MPDTVRDKDLAETLPVIKTSPSDISELMEEAIAVDALFRRMHRGTIDTASALLAYLRAPESAPPRASDDEAQSP